MKKLLLPSIITFAFASVASAHTGHGTNGMTAGLVHPVMGLDHLLAMVAVGIWSTQKGVRSVWLLPVTFVLCMIVGMLIGVAGLQIHGIEYGVQASVIILGLILVAQLKATRLIAALIVGAFALMHGYAHGAEVPENASSLSFCIGMVLSTSVLHFTGVAIGLLMIQYRDQNWIRACGSVIAVYGAMLLPGVV